MARRKIASRRRAPKTAKRTVDPIQALWQSIKARGAVTDAGDEFYERLIEDEGRLADISTTTPLGILRKLQLVAEVECYEHQIEANPRLLAARAVLGIIRDLKADIGIQ